MAVIVDAMGGDKAPDEIVRGAVAASEEYGIEVVLVGHEERLSEFEINSASVTIEHAETVIGMNEHPAKALRRKPDSSIAIAARLAAERDAALLSAGHTGAVMASALFAWGRITGIERPGIACIIPTETRNVVVVDVGANVDCKPVHIEQFAMMGSAYARCVLDVTDPSVGLLNIGEEEKKGNEQTLAAHRLLRENTSLRFVGNVEPKDLYAGAADVVVTDGFAGNIFLKSSEAVSNLLQGLILRELRALNLSSHDVSGLAAALGKYSPRNPKHAGAPLLGVDGTCIITHGGSDCDTVKHCVQLAEQYAGSAFLEQIKKNIAQ